MAKNDDKFSFKEYCKVLTHFSIESNEVLVKKGSYFFKKYNFY